MKQLFGRKLLVSVLPFGIVQYFKGRFSKSKTTRRLYEYEKILNKVGRKEEVEVKFLDKQILVPDFASFCSAYKELFVNEILKFKAKSKSPIIIDLGSNIGVSVAYFKCCYPHAKIYAVEDDPRIFGYLIGNLKRLGFQDVQTTNMAAWSSDMELAFLPDGADGGRIGSSTTVKGAIHVKAFDMGSFLDPFELVELLKMDVEGAEWEILRVCERQMHKIKRLFVEYHSEFGKEQNLDSIINILTRNGFRTIIRTEHCKSSPFISEETSGLYENQLDIFAYRQE